MTYVPEGIPSQLYRFALKSSIGPLLKLPRFQLVNWKSLGKSFSPSNLTSILLDLLNLVVIV